MSQTQVINVPSHVTVIEFPPNVNSKRELIVINSDKEIIALVKYGSEPTITDYDVLLSG